MEEFDERRKAAAEARLGKHLRSQREEQEQRRIEGEVNEDKKSEEESGELRKIAEDAWLGEYLRSEREEQGRKREEQERRKVEGKVNEDKYTLGEILAGIIFWGGGAALVIALIVGSITDTDDRTDYQRPVGNQTSSSCHPSYTGSCVPVGVSDVDCRGGSGNGPYYTGRVIVVGPDVYGLDRDGDGVGCE